jgi:hypothetical protein
MHKWAAMFVAVTMAGLFSACDYVSAYRPPWLSYYSPPPQRSYYSSNPPSYRHHYSERARTTRSRSTPRESGAPATAERSAPPPASDHIGTDNAAPAAAVSHPPSLTLAGDSEDRERAQALLEKTDANLDRVRGLRLSTAQKETYKRASQLASRARQALADNDCAAASSLAGKALSLAAGINGQ